MLLLQEMPGPGASVPPLSTFRFFLLKPILSVPEFGELLTIFADALTVSTANPKPTAILAAAILHVASTCF
ncbi:MAG: hypothetical protein ACK50P_05025 [Planctomycetaceae bacterium]|jgi:hypothetical protein